MCARTGETRRDFFILTTNILSTAGAGLPKLAFLRALLKIMRDATDCAFVSIQMPGDAACRIMACMELRDGLPHFEWQETCENGDRFGSSHMSSAPIPSPTLLRRAPEILGAEEGFSTRGKFHADCSEPSNPAHKASYLTGTPASHGSAAVIPLTTDASNDSVVTFAWTEPGHFTRNEVEFLEDLVQIVGYALRQWQVTWALEERVKEITCLYRISNILDPPGKSLEDVFEEIVSILPTGWLYERDAAARIIFDGLCWISPGFVDSGQQQTAPILVRGHRRGSITVSYKSSRPDLDEGPFLKEERRLLDTVTREVALHIEHRFQEEEHERLREHLKHSNRLAMIGQLAAAVAHELNEPLTNILGFAQLASKTESIPPQAAEDIQRIVASSLHAREIVRKLLMYGRKMPQQETMLDFNKAVREVIGLFEHRLAKEEFVLDLRLCPDKLEILADAGQIRQIVANLVLNAMQAMSKGGTLTVGTSRSGDYTIVSVQDTGCGMSREIVQKIFIPFFTTKESRQGTGLGLTVVHELVSGLGGVIRVDSALGKGTTMEVRLPVPKQGKKKIETETQA